MKTRTLNYIYLNPLFVFDMKDYIMHKNGARAREMTAKDLIFHIERQLKTLHLRPK
jgi:hypothetical protein